MTSLGDYLKDLKLLSLVKSGHIFAKDDWFNGYDTNEIFNPDNINIDFERAYDLLLEHRELILNYGEENSGGEFENVLVKEAQAAFLSLNRFVPSDLANIHYTKLSGIGSSYDNTFSFNRKWSISTSFDTLKPLTLPTQEGDTEIFKERVRQTMDEFSKQFPLLKPLLTNLSLTILYVPPKNQDIDLDNLARYIVPLVNEAIKPPTSFWFSEVPKNFLNIL